MDNSVVKILIVEDEPTVRAALQDNLEFEGYKVLGAANGIEGLDVFERERPDLVILDVMMPGIDGLELCKRIRALQTGTPIIMLTAKCAEVDKVVGLEIGADDYLTKPFGMRELFARIKALLRRVNVLNGQMQVEPNEDGLQEVVIGEVHVDFRTYRARRRDNSEDLSLSAKEFDLLRYLVSRPDIPVSRDQLLDEVWGYNSYPSTRTVDNFIARLRQKFEVSPERPQYIITVHGVGYKYVPAPVLETSAAVNAQ